MKITPVQKPGSTSTYTPPSSDARERAIAKLTAQPSTPVQNQNQVAPEEMLAITNNIDEAPEAVATEETPAAIEETTQEAAPAEEPVSRQLAVLARREKAIRAKQIQMEKDFKAKEDAFKAKEAELLQKSQSFDSSKYISKDRFLNDPLTVMAETGLTYEELTNRMLNVSAVDPQTKAIISKLEEEINSLKSNREQDKKFQTEEQQRQYQAAVNQIRSDAKNLITSDPEFETIKATNSVEDVVELIKETFDKEGILMTVEEAAQEVENYLIEEALKLSKIEKIKKRLAPASTAAKPVQAQTPASNQPKQTQQVKTLTNNIGSSRQISARERAIMAFKGELK